MKNSFFILLLVTGIVFYIQILHTSEQKEFFTKEWNVLALTAEEAVADTGSKWYQEITRKLSQEEYNIHYQPDENTYECPNRTHNLRSTFLPGQVSMRIRQDSLKKENWKLDIRTDALIFDGKYHYYPHSNPATAVQRDTIEFRHGDLFTEQYINNIHGLRQNFIIHRAPINNPGQLRIKLQVSGGLTPFRAHPKEVHFAKAINNGGWDNKIIYKDLHSWDAAGKVLESEMQVENNDLFLVINTCSAVFPVTVDPLSTTASTLLESNQASSNFGKCVSTAGDVNGDGYSDVIVGAENYDNGQTNEGGAFIFHGSATGISTTIATRLESNQSGAEFGNWVSSAGDVNGDGYSDVIVGAPLYTNGSTDEGAAFVYHGSASGITTTVRDQLETNQSNAHVYCVSSAGDVNGDGYSDVIVGARDYDNGSTGEGTALVYHGSSSGISSTVATRLEVNQGGATFGYSVACAGDVNGDGYSDVIVGANFYTNGQTDEEAAFIFHGSASGITTTIRRQLERNQSYANFGINVACAGDVNGDGYSDVIVGAYTYDNGSTDEGAAFIYHGSSTGVTTTLQTQLEVNQTDAHLGYSCTSAGDVNGDGYADVIVSSDWYTNGQTDEGAAFIYHGSSGGISTTVQSQLEGNQTSGHYGINCAPAGDVNGDGYSDVIVGASTYDNGISNEGAAFVYHGSSSGTTVTAGIQLESNQANAFMGYSVASAGDVNGDGYSDVIVTAESYDNGEFGEGAAFIYHGSTSGLGAIQTQLESNHASAYMGAGASAGDVNGDGYGDIILGAKLYDNGQTNEGAALIFHGSASGVTTTVQAQLEINQANAEFGGWVASAGDVNGDGYSDVIVGAKLYDNGQTDEGAAFAYHGSASGINSSIATQLESNQAGAQAGICVASAGDVNGDGFSDVIIGANLYDNGHSDEGAAFVYHGSLAGIITTVETQLEINQAGAEYGFSVAAAGNVNGDAYNDVLIGAYKYDNGQTDEGAGFVYHGSATGITTTIRTRLERNQTSAYLGTGISSAGDVNGDGYSDVIIGADYYDNGSADEGAAFIYHGSSSGITTTVQAQLEINQATSNFASAVASAGDINGDGYCDIILGAYRYNNGQTDEGAAFIYYGNNEEGKRNNLRLYNTNLTTPINQSNISSSTFGAGLFAKSFIGRVEGRLVWEVKTPGSAFSAGGGQLDNSVSYTSQGSFTNLGTAGTELKSLVTKPGRQSKIRARIAYDKATAITGQMYGPWIYSAAAQAGMIGMTVTPLPIKLLSFDARPEGNKVLLQWKTTSEINNDFFTIERSKDGSDWIFVDKISGEGNSNVILSYASFDEFPYPGISYYRLKQTDFDGKYSYSNPVPVEFAKEIQVQFFPNPATDRLNLLLGDENSEFVIDIYNTTGQKLASYPLQSTGNSITSISISTLPPAMYYIRCRHTSSSNYFFSSRFSKN